MTVHKLMARLCLLVAVIFTVHFCVLVVFGGETFVILFVGQSYGSEGPRSPNSELQQDSLSLLLAEIRSLRVQLEKSIQTNNALRLKLEEQLARPLGSPSQSPSRSQVTVIRQLNFSEGRDGDDTGSVSSVRGEYGRARLLHCCL